MEKVSQPSYSFTVDSADFLVMDEFEAFKNALSLGKRVYLKLDNGRVLTPLLLGFSHTFDEKSGLTLEFSNKFTSNDENDRLVTLLEQSVSMGKKLDMNRETYVAFVDSHANTAFDQFYSSSIDMAMHDLFVSNGWSWTLDENGLRMRQPKEGSDTEFEPEQLWINGRSIMFTDDGWQTAKMGIGKIVYPSSEIKGAVSGSMWGVIAPNLVGEAVIGKTLAMYCPDETGGAMQFRFDSEGLYSYNAHQLWRGQSGGFAMLDPDYGFMLGTEGNPLIVGNDGRVRPSCIDENGNVRFEDDTNKSGIHIPVGMNLYMDKTGKLYTRGEIFANNFCFIDGSGDVKTILSNVQNDLDATKKMSKFDLSDVDVIDLGGMILDGRPGSTGIRFNPGYEPIKYQFSATAAGPWHDTMQANDKYRRDCIGGTWGEAYQFRGTDGKNGTVNYDRVNQILKETYGITTTYITEGAIGSPVIQGAKIYGGELYAGGGSGSFSMMDEDGLKLYAGGVVKPKVKINVGYNGLDPQVVLGAGDGNQNSQIFTIDKNPTQGRIIYRGTGGNACGFVFDEDGAIFPAYDTKMTGTWDFTGATVTGINAVFA